MQHLLARGHVVLRPGTGPTIRPTFDGIVSISLVKQESLCSVCLEEPWSHAPRMAACGHIMCHRCWLSCVGACGPTDHRDVMAAFPVLSVPSSAEAPVASSSRTRGAVSMQCPLCAQWLESTATKPVLLRCAPTPLDISAMSCLSSFVAPSQQRPSQPAPAKATSTRVSRPVAVSTNSGVASGDASAAGSLWHSASCPFVAASETAALTRLLSSLPHACLRDLFASTAAPGSRSGGTMLCSAATHDDICAPLHPPDGASASGSPPLHQVSFTPAWAGPSIHGSRGGHSKSRAAHRGGGVATSRIEGRADACSDALPWDEAGDLLLSLSDSAASAVDGSSASLPHGGGHVPRRGAAAQPQRQASHAHQQRSRHHSHPQQHHPRPGAIAQVVVPLPAALPPPSAAPAAPTSAAAEAGQQRPRAWAWACLQLVALVVPPPPATPDATPPHAFARGCTVPLRAVHDYNARCSPGLSIPIIEASEPPPSSAPAARLVAASAADDASTLRLLRTHAAQLLADAAEARAEERGFAERAAAVVDEVLGGRAPGPPSFALPGPAAAAAAVGAAGTPAGAGPGVWGDRRGVASIVHGMAAQTAVAQTTAATAAAVWAAAKGPVRAPAPHSPGLPPHRALLSPSSPPQGPAGGTPSPPQPGASFPPLWWFSEQQRAALTQASELGARAAHAASLLEGAAAGTEAAAALLARRLGEACEAAGCAAGAPERQGAGGRAGGGGARGSGDPRTAVLVYQDAMMGGALLLPSITAAILVEAALSSAATAAAVAPAAAAAAAAAGVSDAAAPAPPASALPPALILAPIVEVQSVPSARHDARWPWVQHATPGAPLLWLDTDSRLLLRVDAAAAPSAVPMPVGRAALERAGAWAGVVGRASRRRRLDRGASEPPSATLGPASAGWGAALPSAPPALGGGGDEDASLVKKGCAGVPGSAGPPQQQQQRVRTQGELYKDFMGITAADALDAADGMGQLLGPPQPPPSVSDAAHFPSLQQQAAEAQGPQRDGGATGPRAVVRGVTTASFASVTGQFGHFPTLQPARPPQLPVDKNPTSNAPATSSSSGTRCMGADAVLSSEESSAIALSSEPPHSTTSDALVFPDNNQSLQRTSNVAPVDGVLRSVQARRGSDLDLEALLRPAGSNASGKRRVGADRRKAVA